MLAVGPLKFLQHTQNIRVPLTSGTLGDDHCADYPCLSCFRDTPSYSDAELPMGDDRLQLQKEETGKTPRNVVK